MIVSVLIVHDIGIMELKVSALWGSWLTGFCNICVVGTVVFYCGMAPLVMFIYNLCLNQVCHSGIGSKGYHIDAAITLYAINSQFCGVIDGSLSGAFISALWKTLLTQYYNQGDN